MKTNEKDTKQGVVPALRFPEFSEAGEWQPASISALADATKGEQVNKIYLKPVGSYPVVNGGTQPSGYIEEYNTPAHTITISEGGNSCGFVNIINTNFWCGGHCYAIREKKGIDKFFLYQLLKKEEPSIMKLRVGSGLPNIQLKDLKKHPTHIPCTQKEQQKIADCLSSIDALIKTAENKLDELNAHKKGLMQQLFPAEGKTVPALRFPEFQNAGEWKKGPLFRIGEVLQGYGFPEKYQGKSLGKYPFYKVSDISKAVQTGCNFISKAANYIDDEELDILKIKTIPPGTTIFARIGEAIRLNRRIVTTQECIVDNNTVGVKAIPENAIDLFVYYILLQVDLIDFAGGVVPAITKSAIENIPIYCPPTKSEQQKIADCLSSVDDLIIAQTNRLEALKAHKKGLMQQLFPNIE